MVGDQTEVERELQDELPQKVCITPGMYVGTEVSSADATTGSHNSNARATVAIIFLAKVVRL